MTLLSVVPHKTHVLMHVFEPDPKTCLARELHEWADSKGLVLDDSRILHYSEVWVFVPREEHAHQSR